MVGQYGRYLTLFSRELIDATRVEVVPGKLAFMGSYYVGESARMGPADPLQKHYAELFAPGLAESHIKQFLFFSMLYRGTMGKGRRDEAAQAEFSAESREDLTRSGWEEILK
jgi:hypothetical protein